MKKYNNVLWCLIVFVSCFCICQAQNDKDKIDGIKQKITATYDKLYSDLTENDKEIFANSLKDDYSRKVETIWADDVDTGIEEAETMVQATLETIFKADAPNEPALGKALAEALRTNEGVVEMQSDLKAKIGSDEAINVVKKMKTALESARKELYSKWVKRAQELEQEANKIFSTYNGLLKMKRYAAEGKTASEGKTAGEGKQASVEKTAKKVTAKEMPVKAKKTKEQVMISAKAIGPRIKAGQKAIATQAQIMAEIQKRIKRLKNQANYKELSKQQVELQQRVSELYKKSKLQSKLEKEPYLSRFEQELEELKGEIETLRDEVR